MSDLAEIAVGDPEAIGLGGIKKLGQQVLDLEKRITEDAESCNRLEAECMGYASDRQAAIEEAEEISRQLSLAVEQINKLQDQIEKLDDRYHQIFDEANLCRVKNGRMLLPDRIRYACEQLKATKSTTHAAKLAERAVTAEQRAMKLTVQLANVDAVCTQGADKIEEQREELLGLRARVAELESEQEDPLIS